MKSSTFTCGCGCCHTLNFNGKHCGKRSSFRAPYNFVDDVLSEVGQRVDQLQVFAAVSG